MDENSAIFLKMILDERREEIKTLQKVIGNLEDRIRKLEAIVVRSQKSGTSSGKS